MSSILLSVRCSRWSLLLAAVLLIGGASAGLRTSSTHASPSAAGSPIKVGFFAPETGFAAADGTSALNSAKLAVSKINKGGGIGSRKITLVNYDDGSDAKQAAAIATKLVTQDNVTAVVSGSYSDQTLASAPIFQRNKTPMLASYAVNPGIPKAGGYIFQQDFNGTVEGRAGAWALIHDLHGKKIGIVSINNDFGTSLVKGFTEEARKLHATIVGTDYNQFGEKDFTPVINRDLGKGANGFYMVEYTAEGLTFVHNYHTVRAKKPVVGTEGLDSETQFVEIAGAAANGIVITSSFDRSSKSKQTVQYMSSYRRAYGHNPDMVGATVYDAFMLEAHAMHGGTSADQIRAAIAGTKNFHGITGRILRYSGGQAVKPVQLVLFRNRAFHRYGVVNQASLIQP